MSRSRAFCRAAESETRGVRRHVGFILRSVQRGKPPLRTTELRDSGTVCICNMVGIIGCPRFGVCRDGLEAWKPWVILNTQYGPGYVGIAYPSGETPYYTYQRRYPNPVSSTVVYQSLVHATCLCLSNVSKTTTTTTTNQIQALYSKQRVALFA